MLFSQHHWFQVQNYIMLRYLPGIVLVQLVTFTLYFVNQEASLEHLLLRVGLPALVISGVTALWLSMIGRMDAEQRNSTLREQHAVERTQLNREIERARADAMLEASTDRAQLMERANTERERLVRQTHKQLMKQERSASRRANLKVGLAFMVLTGFGAFMLVSQFMMLGVLMISAASGAMGGYLLRWKQSKQMLDRLTTLSPKNAQQSIPSLPSESASLNVRDKRSVKQLAPIELDANGSVSSSKVND
jgi:hypothetical protein